MRVLIYGGVGFIGASVVEEFRDFEIYVAHRPGSTAKRPAVAEFVKKYANLIEYRDPSAPLAEVRPEVVVNLVGEYFGPPEALREANAEFPKALCAAARAAGWRGKVVHISAATVRGPVGSVIREEESHLVGVEPVTDFDKFKAEGEAAVARCFEDWVVVRPVVVYGRFNDHPEWVTLVKFVKRGVAPAVSARVSVISVRELAKAIRHSLGLSREFFFATECTPRRLADFVDAAAEALGRRVVKVPVPSLLFKAAAPRDLRKHMAFIDRAFSCEKMKRLLGWEPRPDFRREVAEMVKFISERGL
ncbi:MAG: NAD(P)-dependent oxidoreductase [Pyrobaculum sp.]